MVAIMGHDTTSETPIVLKDGRTMIVRLVNVAESTVIAHEHPLPRAGNASEALYRNYYELKALQYARTPGAGIMSGWIDGKLAGFIFVATDISNLKRHLVSPANLLWLAKETVLGRFSYRPAFWMESLRWGLQHFRQPHDYKDQAAQPLPEIRSWIGTVHTVDSFRRIGVASALLAQVEALLLNRGCQQVALWAADDNEPALQLYEILGFQRVTKVGRIEEQCWLMLKTLNAEART
jgi:ribosomal protein S18 acetylase RimI-like enzyme